MSTLHLLLELLRLFSVNTGDETSHSCLEQWPVATEQCSSWAFDE